MISAFDFGISLELPRRVCRHFAFEKDTKRERRLVWTRSVHNIIYAYMGRGVDR